MSIHLHYYNEVARNSSTWAHPDRDLCGCGGGWWLSEVDTWHKCPYHDKDATHPEWEEEEPFIGPVQEVAKPEPPVWADDEIPF
jgi:hypothetical protein